MAAVVFTEDWTGTDGAAWNTSRWPDQSSEGSVDHGVEIDTNQGLLFAEGSTNDFASAVGNSSTNIQNASLYFDLDSGTTDTDDFHWMYAMLRSSGEQVAANAGRPATAYYLRIPVSPGLAASSTKMYRRLSNSEVQIGGTLSGFDDWTGPGNKAEVRLEVEDSGTDVIVRISIWDFGTTEPAAWDHTITDSSPGALADASGKLQLNIRTYSDGAYTDAILDNLELTDMDATAGGGDTSLAHFASMATLLD